MGEAIINFISYNLWIPWVFIAIAVFILYKASKL